MEPAQFDRRFREITGNAALTWLTHQRVLRAQQLLEATRLPVEEVDRRCGFSSAPPCASISGRSPGPPRPPTGPRSALRLETRAVLKALS